ncbi:LysR family transcriptional regulator [Streptomyces iranensis]|uniref:DNA-binding transcriptional LysR family regulator n=1 Tax=Streptomyces iranensis TaxID=576784 RepID=A0A060ZM25_9ACTN|nr:LysR substrate-binding domain-containing protein [Streptomyces iranensis]MBP2067164.1 DNA-binding transcriptional LysR family regulator [Streptomyces iranensis]CDR07212.1 LysR family transcriptional regulator [Streptomyces iranensis]
MELDLRLLRYFVAVAQDLHFGRAAARLHISQPALSVQIRKLEHVLGVEVFRRTSRHVELTPAGQAILAEATRTLAAAERTMAVARSAARGKPGHLTVGFVANAVAELTPVILEEFGRRHPHVDIQMKQFAFADPLAGLGNGDADVAFVRPPLRPDPAIEWCPVLDEGRVLILSERHPLAQYPAVTVEMLINEPFVARRAPDEWRDFWLGVDHRDGHAVRIGAEVSTVDECLEAVLTGQGIAFTQSSSQRYYSRPGLAFVAVKGLSGSTAAVAWRRDAATPLVNEFVTAAQNVCRCHNGAPTQFPLR